MICKNCFEIVELKRENARLKEENNKMRGLWESHFGEDYEGLPPIESITTSATVTGVQDGEPTEYTIAESEE